MIALLLAAASVPDYPQKAVLAAFEQVCRRIADMPATTKAARAKGWAEASPSAEPHLDKLVALGMAQEASGTKSGGTYRREVKGRTLYLVLSRYVDASLWGNGCRVYDFAAAAAIPQADLEAWMKQPSTFRQAQDGVLTKLSWQPGWPDGVTVEAGFVPEGSTLTERTGLIGTVLVAEASGRVAP